VQKEVRFRDVITDHDLQIKIGKVKEFLAKGNRVKLVLIFKKRADFDLTTANDLISTLKQLNTMRSWHYWKECHHELTFGYY